MNHIKEKSCLAAFIKTVTLGLSTDSQVKATLYGIKNGTTGKYCSLSFNSTVTIQVLIQRQKVRVNLHFAINGKKEKECSVEIRTSPRSEAPAFVPDYSGRADFLRLVPLLLSKLSCLVEKKIPTAISLHSCLNVPWIKPSISLKALKGYNGLDDERPTITQRCTKSMKRLT